MDAPSGAVGKGHAGIWSWMCLLDLLRLCGRIGYSVILYGLRDAQSGKFRKQIDLLREDLGIAGQNITLVEVVRIALEAADDTTGFGDQQGTGRNIPRFQTFFEEAIETTGGDIGQVKRSSAGTAQAGTAFGHDAEHFHVFVEAVHVAEREAGADQAISDLVALAYANAFLIEIGTRAFGGGKQVVAGRVVDHRLGDLATLLQGDRNAVLRKTVDEIGSAVEWIDDPDVFIFVVQIGRGARLFGQDGVIWISGLQDVDDGFFSGLIDFGDEVVVLLLGDFEQGDVEGRSVDDGGGAAGCLDRRIEHGRSMHPEGSVKMASSSRHFCR